MDCPICGGNGELECTVTEPDTASGAGGETFSRECVGSLIITCFRCNGSGFLEVVN